MIVGSLVVGPIAANCYIVGDRDSQEGVIIDPGDEAERILKVVAENELDMKYIISTHGHFDHNGAVKKVRDNLKCDYLLHELDLPFIKEGRQSALNWGIVIDDIPEPNRFVKDGDMIEVGGLLLKILHTPGHSPGGICIYFESEGVVFSGDTIFFGSIGRTDFTQGSLRDITRSIKEKLYVLPDDTIIYTGHGEKTTVGYEKKHNPYVQG